MMYWLILGSYLLGSFIFLILVERRMKNIVDNVVRKQQVDSGIIICSIRWLPLLIFITLYVLTKRIFERN